MQSDHAKGGSVASNTFSIHASTMKTAQSLRIAALCVCGISAFVPQRPVPLHSLTHHHGILLQVQRTGRPATSTPIKQQLKDSLGEESSSVLSSSWTCPPAVVMASALVIPIALSLVPDAALAIGAPNTAILPNALVAYGHYFFILVSSAICDIQKDLNRRQLKASPK